MVVERTEMRLTVAEQVSRRQEFRGRGLAVEVLGARGFGTRATEVLSHLPALLAAKGVEVRVYTPLGLELNAANLVGRTAADIDAMAAEVDALSQAGATRRPQIEIPETIDNPRLPFIVMKNVVGGTGNKSLLDGRAYAKDLNEAHGRKFRVPTESEVLQLNKVLADQLEGKDYWTWTETLHEEYQGAYVLRHLGYVGRIGDNPEGRCSSRAVRLVKNR